MDNKSFFVVLFINMRILTFFAAILFVLLLNTYCAIAAVTPVYQYVRATGSSATEASYEVAANASGSYVAGVTTATSIDFDPGAGTDLYNGTGNFNTFVTHFAADGTYAWTKVFSGEDNYSNDIDVDADGNVYITGYFTDTVDFDPGAGTTNISPTGIYDVYTVKLDSSGNLVWVRTVGGGSDWYGYGLSISGDAVYVVGTFSASGSADFDPTSGTDTKATSGTYDIFLSKYGTDGSYGWTKVISSSGWDAGYNVASTNDSVYITGRFVGTNTNFNPDGSDLHTSNGNADVFLTKFASNGTYGWTKTFGGASVDYGQAISANSSGVILGGYFYGSGVDFDPSGGTASYSSNGDADVYVSSFASDGTYGWTKTFGGSGMDEANSIVQGANGVYVSGNFRGSNVNFNPAGSDLRSSAGGADGYVVRLATDGTYGWTKTFGGTADDFANGLAFTGAGYLYVNGSFQNTVNFNPDDDDSRVSAGGYDAYLALWRDVYPTAPTSVQARPASSTSITVSWAQVSGADSYVIYRSATSGGVYTSVGTASPGTATTFTNTGLTQDTTYYYKVASVQATVESTQSSVASATTTLGVTVSGSGLTVSERGTTATYTVVLISQPDSSVTITPTPDAQLTVSPATLTFTTSNWNTPQTVTVRAVDDATYEQTHSGSITHAPSSSDAYYGSVSVAPISVSIIDNDKNTGTRISTGGSSMIARVASPVQQQPASPDGVLTVCEPYLTTTLSSSMNNDPAQVRKLQAFLREYQSEQIAETGVFDQATKAAVIRFQEKYASDVLGFWKFTKGTGMVAETTRAKINALVCAKSNPALTCPYVDFAKPGDVGENVSKLQRFLTATQSEQFPITGTYDAATTAAVKRYQQKWASAILAPWKFTSPTGIVSQTTRKQIHRDIGCFELPTRLPSGAIIP